MNKSVQVGPSLLGSGTAPQYTASRCGTPGRVTMPGGGAHYHVLHAYNGAICCGPSTI